MAKQVTKDGKKLGWYKVIPTSQENFKQGYLTVSTGEFHTSRIIPLDKRVALTDKEVHAIKRMKEHITIDKRVDVREIMDRHQIPQTQANAVAQSMDQSGGKKIQWVPKYTVVPA